MPTPAASIARILIVLLACMLTGAAKGTAPLLFVVNEEKASVAVFDTHKDTQIGDVNISPGAAEIAAAPDGLHLYITHPAYGKITVLDKETMTARGIGIGGSPSGIAAKAGGRVFVTDPGRGTLIVLDAESGNRLAEIKVGRAPAGLRCPCRIVARSWPTPRISA
ncbi:MAG: YncE family protein [Methyloceanibacter sp.]|uniref:YncE family protein n=1 Tax=Methyloceanibacter sp. TaxID=1965321 RepID=UPI003D9BA04E